MLPLDDLCHPVTGNTVPPNATLVFDKELVRIIYGKLRWHKLSGPECDDDEKVKDGDVLTVYYSGFSKEEVRLYTG